MKKSTLCEKNADAKFAGSAYTHFLIWGICASLATAVCTIVDALLVGNLIGSDGLAVANISTPVFLLYALLGITTGIGANVRIGRLLGSGDIGEANRVFSAQLSFGILLGAVCLLPLLFKDAYFSFLGVTDSLYPLAERYLTVVMWSAPVFIMYHILSASVRTDSDPALSAAASAVVIIANLSLDIIFMSLLGWGIIGASASLCIAEALGTLVLLAHFLKKNRLLKLRLVLPTPADVRGFIANGFGIGSANIFGAIVMLAFNTMLIRFGGSDGTLGVAVYGVIYTISTVPCSVFDGASNALSTVTAFFAGESDIRGIFAVLKKAVLTALIGGAAFAAACEIFPDLLVKFFGISDSAVQYASGALRIFAVSIIFTGVNTVITSFWQSIGRAKLAGTMSVVRNCLLMLAVGAVFIPQANINGLSAAYVCTEILCSLICVGVLIFNPSKKYMSEKYGSAGRTFENIYVIKSTSAEQISGDLEKICDEWEIGTKQTFFINFICEELLLNITKFALGNSGKDYYISIKLMEKDGDYALRIRDNVRMYNPFESNGDNIDNGVLRLIKTKTKYCDYQRKMIFNYLYVII